jgi:hypothetical protein
MPFSGPCAASPNRSGFLRQFVQKSRAYDAFHDRRELNDVPTVKANMPGTCDILAGCKSQAKRTNIRQIADTLFGVLDPMFA